MAQRLALHHILTNQLKDMNASNVVKRRRHISEDRKHFNNEMPNVKETVDTILAKIHTTMKTSMPPRKVASSVPAPIEEIPAPAAMTFKKRRSSTGPRITGGQSLHSTIASSPKNMSIPALKATLLTKKMVKRGHMDVNGLQNQMRIREVLQQRTVLENMLQQHKKLQRDRQNIAMDIQRIRMDLDRIRTKLDTSLQSLNSTRTIFSGTVKGKKSQQRSSATMQNPLRRRNSNPTTKNKSSARSKAEPLVRSNSVVKKRQHVTPSPKRRTR